MAKKEVGRPTVMTPEVLAKLDEVFALGGTDGEAIFYADISKDAFYDYQLKTPGYSERKEKLKERPILKARQTIVKGLDQADNARWFLERKLKNEFATRSELTGKDGKDLVQEALTKEEKDKLLKLLK